MRRVSFAGFALLVAGRLLVGFLTPIVTVVIGLGAIVLGCVGHPLPVQSPIDDVHTLVDLFVLSMAILLLGPGAFSLDARMFGRREIRIPHLSHPIPKQM